MTVAPLRARRMEKRVENEYEILKKEVGFDGFFKLERYRLRHTLFAGGWTTPMTRELFERGHAAAILPYDPVRDTVVLVEQFRIGALGHPNGPWLTEIVAGMIGEGETPEDVVRREALEEAGCTIGRVEFICDCYVSPGGTSEMVSVYCGEVDSAGLDGQHHGLPHEHEDIRVHVVPAEDALRRLHANALHSASPILTLQWLERERPRLRREWA
jgi:ADP-ribose pyrophosphatase